MRRHSIYTDRGSALIELPLAMAVVAVVLGLMVTVAARGWDWAWHFLRADAAVKKEWVQ